MTATPTPYRGLPTLAALATLADAARSGLSVEACVARLKRYHYAFQRLHEILTARITAEPVYELKTALAHHAYLRPEDVQRLPHRIAAQRDPAHAPGSARHGRATALRPRRRRA